MNTDARIMSLLSNDSRMSLSSERHWFPPATSRYCSGLIRTRPDARRAVCQQLCATAVICISDLYTCRSSIGAFGSTSEWQSWRSWWAGALVHGPLERPVAGSSSYSHWLPATGLAVTLTGA